MRVHLFIAASAAALVSASATANGIEAPVAPNVAAAPTQAEASAALHALFKESDEDNLRRNPIEALFRGDMRYADQLGDNISDAYFDAERAAGEKDLAALGRIDRAALSPTDQLAYDIFKWQTELALRSLSAEILPLTVVRPIDHFTGLHVFYPDLASGQSAAPYKTVKDYQDSISRHHRYAWFIDAAIERFRQGMKSGVVQPKLVVRNVTDQLDLQLAQGVEGSTLYAPLKAFPADIPAADQARLRAETAAVIRDEIHPAYQRLRDFLAKEYLPAAREGVGLVHMKGGPALYSFLIEENTTLKLSADDVHKLGLSEVARIHREMETVKNQTGFKGNLQDFFEFLRTDGKFRPASKEALRDEYYAIGKRVDARVGTIFSTLPKTRLEIRPVPEYREKNDAGGSYMQGAPDGSRPGVFYYNTYDLPSRSTWGQETLYLHEGAPGHHFQISLAQENEALPNFMRFGGNTAYAEGWALYAETLWDELGMETDPYQRFGGLNDEMLRAMRLVVDSGIHAKGWTRDQAIKYMLDNSSMGRTDATSEVERYIAMPGQALAYKIGQLKILELRARAEKALGAKFDLKEFHAQVLMTGALPLNILEQKIARWIASKRP
ncbi:DUF885 domain-containing protein [Sphingomonas psychrotolerans]|uniref:DUF885 domain-containing protein n=1 Tax=Sphingomonas psychrotolerans TaxID=1327635 RepID=A0A2K8MDY8_9SPHN|nr:DUF885 domain-containing protein [Sphingomonas psychrotolerans]ATY32105.1 DUF885 domain-containing protein [Sphingomonas psychrotolerans]